MRNSARVKAIFHELRAAGVDASARDLLRLAYLILTVDQADAAAQEEISRVVDSRTLPMLAVDVAINNWSWRVLDFERWRQVVEDPDPSIECKTIQRLNSFLGRQWERRTPLG